MKGNVTKIASWRSALLATATLSTIAVAAPLVTYNHAQADSSATQDTIKTGTWGSASWTFDTNTGVMTIGSGTINGATDGNLYTFFNKQIGDPKAVKQVQISGNVQLVGDATGLFTDLFSMTSFTLLPGASLDTSQVTNMTNMFALDQSLVTIDLSTWDMSHVQSIAGMFTQPTTVTPALTSVIGLETRNLSAVKDAGLIFDSSSLDGQGTMLGNSWEWTSGNHPVLGLARSTNFHWGTANATLDPATGTLTVGAADDGSAGVLPTDATTVLSPADQAKVQKIVFTQPVKTGQNALGTLRGFSNLTSIEGMQNLDTSQTTDFTGFFSGDAQLQSIDLSHFNTQNATEMYDMFNGTKSLTNLDVSNFDMSHVVDMWGMFSNMYRLQSITGISNLDVSNVNNMCDLFFNDMSLQSLDLSSWNAKLTKAGAITRGATTGEGTSGMFANTISLKNLDISGIDNTDDSSQANMFLMDPGMADSSTSPFAANQYTSHLTHLVLGSKFVMTSDNDLDATMPKATWNRYDSNGKLVVLSGSEINNGQANPGDWQVGQSYQFFDSVTKQQIGGNYIIQGIPGSTVTVSIPAGYQLVGSTLYQLDGTTKQGTTDQFALDQTLNSAQPVAFYLVKIDPVTVTFVDHGRVVSSAQETTVEGQVVNLHDQIPAGYQVVDPTQLVFRAGGQDINQTIEVEINGDHQPSSTTSGTASGSPSTGSAAASSASPIVKRVDLFDNRDNGSLPHTAARVIKSSFSMLFSFEAIGVTTVAVAGFFKKNRH